MTVPGFIHTLGQKVEGINLLEIEAYLRCSKVYIRRLEQMPRSDYLQIARKISRYAAVSEGLYTLDRRTITLLSS